MNKPIVNYLMEKIENLKNYCPIEGVIIVSNNRFYENFLAWRDRYRFDVEIINDGSNNPQERRGAIKAIQLALGGRRQDCVVMGGDNIFDDDLTRFLDFSLRVKPCPCVALSDVKRKEEATRFGVVSLNDASQVTELIEKPEIPLSTLVATCLYFFPAQSLMYMDAYLNDGSPSDVAGKYIEWLLPKTKVFGSVLSGEWLDIGSKEALRQAEKTLARV